jgi:acyl dehydratase
MEFNLAELGKWQDELEFKVDKDRVIAYAKATNDPIAQHRSGELAPPIFAIVPVFEALIPAALNVAPAELIAFLVHGEQDMYFHRPIVPGMTLTARARATGVAAKSSGTTLAIKVETRSGDELVNEQWMTAFFRGFSAGQNEGEMAPAHGFPAELRETGPTAAVTQHVDDDQTFRYAEASGDPMPIHLDEEIAKSAGLPGIIAHGLCTMAFTSHAVIGAFAGGDPTRLKRLAVRFSKPVLPGQDITTRIWSTPDGSVVFETTADTGDVVIKDGRAELAPHGTGTAG